MRAAAALVLVLAVAGCTTTGGYHGATELAASPARGRQPPALRQRTHHGAGLGGRPANQVAPAPCKTSQFCPGARVRVLEHPAKGKWRGAWLRFPSRGWLAHEIAALYRR